jgi:alkylation response protein AidB-like acyl-CoA dehydrogenase
MLDRDIVQRARTASAIIAPLAARIESERRLPTEAVAALVDAGAFKLLVPKDLGGADAHPRTVVAVIEEIARADGSAGWCTMIGATSGLMSRFVDEATARSVYSARGAITCGVFAPLGRATREAGGYRVRGRWPFASGCQHASHRMGGAIVAGDPPLPNGAPDVRSFLFRADETRVIDTWSTSGLCGTGSHDIEAEDVLVPVERTFSLLTDRPRGRPIPFFGLLAAGVAAVGLGIARAALDAVIDHARARTPLGAKRSIAHRETLQLDVARAEALYRSARAFLHEALDEAQDEADREGAVGLARRASLRVAASHAATQAADVVTTAWRAAGGAAIYDENPMQRLFRDAHVVTQHVMVGAAAATTAGRVLLGLDTDATTL